MPLTFTTLGTGAGPGTPSFFCNCPGCREAQADPAQARTRSSALIAGGEENILIDAPPDLRVQLLRERVGRIDNVFLTHWHYDHFGGLGELEYYVKLERRVPIPFYLPPSAEAEFAAAFPNLPEIFRVSPWEFGRPYRFGEVSITPLAANHGVETAGFLVASPRARIAYFPDTAGLPAETLRLVDSVDWLICDATFYGDNWFPHSHMSVAEAILLGQRVGSRHTALTHLSIHYSTPVTSRDLTAAVAGQPNVSVAYDGMVIHL